MRGLRDSLTPVLSPQPRVIERIALGALAPQAHAAGFYLQEQAARGTGRAYSGEVADQGPASLWWNPAAIARSPREVHLGASAIFVDLEVVKNTGSTITYPDGGTRPAGGRPALCV